MIFPLVFVASLSALQPPPDADVEGRYRLSLTLPIAQSVPVFGSFDRVIHLSAIVDIQTRDGAARQQTSACDLEAEGGSVARLSVPDAFVDALDIPPSEVDLSGGGLSTELRGVHLGYQPKTEGSPPPSSADDDSVFDADRDGHPGVTIVLRVLQLGELELFVAQHYHLRLVGKRAGQDSYQGKVDVIDFAQSVFGSQPAIPGGTEDLELTASDGDFTLEKVPPETTCSDV